MKYIKIKELARILRKNQTAAEKILWDKIRRRQVGGYKFIRQHPFIYESIDGEYYFYIADFYYAKKKLIIELDGKIHEKRKEHDQHRDDVLQGMNLHIMRIKNEDLKDIDDVVTKIYNFLKSVP